MDFSKRYPHISWWIENQGWVEIGSDELSNSLIRVIDEGGVWWEDELATKTIGNVSKSVSDQGLQLVAKYCFRSNSIGFFGIPFSTFQHPRRSKIIQNF